MPGTIRPIRQLSIGQARRIALGAQGFNMARPTGRVDRRHLRRVLDQIGLIQIDSVNVLARSQELVLFARLGQHPRTLIEDATAAGELYEYWVHEASHVPVDHYHLHRWRMDRPLMWRSLERLRAERPGFIDHVESFIADHGPIVASDLKQRTGQKGPWWDWDDGKVAVEVLFHLGRVAAVRRPSDFAKVYDLTERVIPADALNRPALNERDARKELSVNAARHYGVATDKDLADYHRQKITDVRPLIAELAEDGRLQPVEVEGWRETAYLHPDAKLPRSIDATALLSPFDPVCWYRDRAARLWGFHYRIEIYTPKPKRRYGYYVLPLLVGDRLVGRVDLKADRAASQLLVQAAWMEDGLTAGEVIEPLVPELDLMAEWLQLDQVVWTGRGNLGP